MTIRAHILEAAKKVKFVSTTPRLDAEVLLAWILGVERSWIIAHADDSIDEHKSEEFFRLVSERATGKPIAYITGSQEFYGREFFVDERVLIPRPETEELIDAVVEYIRKNNFTKPRILDIGTGSGCIAVTLKKECPEAQVTATDISAKALTVARKNAEQLSAEIAFYEGNLFDALPEKQVFDCIISNPPYVDFEGVDRSSKESHALKFEPRHALSTQTCDPFETIEEIIAKSGDYLQKAGALFIEIGHNQGSSAQKTAALYFPQRSVSIQQDYTGRDRIVVIF